MEQKHLTLAYCSDNQATAQLFEQQLQAAGYHFSHLSCQKDTTESPLFECLRSVDGKVVILISDNLLKSTSCLAGALQFFQGDTTRILPVVIEGTAVNETTGLVETVPTHFERVSDIIQYINYWQDRYLDIRRQKRHLEGIDEDGFNAHLQVMRDISSEVGELLRLLRSADCISLEELQVTNFERFFRFTGDADAEREFRIEMPASPAMPSVVVEPGADAALDTAGAAAHTPPPPELAGEMISGHGLSVGELEESKLGEEIPEADAEKLEDEWSQAPQDLEPFSNLPGEEPPAPFELPETPDAGVEPVHEGKSKPQPNAEEVQAEVSRIMQQSSQLAALGKKEDNFALLTQAIADYPYQAELRYPYALALVQNTDDLAEASNQLELLLLTQPGHTDARFLLGELAEMRQDLPTAQNAYEKLLEFDQGYAEAWFRLGSVLLSGQNGQEARAAACFDKAVELNPAHAEAHYQSGLSAADAGNDDNAEARFRSALEWQPDHPFAWYDLALLYHRRGEAERAFEAYQHSVINNHEFKTPQNDMAFEYHRAARGAKTAEIIEKEQSALVEMRENLNRLEALLREREEELQQLAAKPEAGQTVLITGATSGIGKATAFVFAENGCRLILTGRRAERLEAVKAQLEAEYEAQVRTIILDVRSAEIVQQAIDGLPDEWKHIDILVNNAGKAKGLAEIHEGRLEHWDEMIDTNVKGLLYVTKAVAPQMVARRSGHIINVGSTAGKDVYPKGNVYCATKAAVDALTRSMRQDLYTHNVRVSQVSPAHVEETEFALVRFDGDSDRAKIYQDFKPLSSHDVAEAIYFMASRPPHVDVLDMVLGGVQQAASLLIDRSGRHE